MNNLPQKLGLGEHVLCQGDHLLRGLVSKALQASNLDIELQWMKKLQNSCKRWVYGGDHA